MISPSVAGTRIATKITANSGVAAPRCVFRLGICSSSQERQAHRNMQRHDPPVQVRHTHIQRISSHAQTHGYEIGGRTSVDNVAATISPTRTNADDAGVRIATFRNHSDHVHRQVGDRSEEHTSELQSPDHLVCRLLLEKKKNRDYTTV